MAEKKYIDAEKVIKLLRKDLICKYPSTFAFGLWAAADEIAKMDGEDVRPVKRGEWVGDYDGYADGMPVYDMWSCPFCGKRFDEWDERPSWNFCPNCGADMRGEEK